MKRLLHWLGIHWWRLVPRAGHGNLYFECTVCGRRRVRSVRFGFQPIDIEWLLGAKRPPCSGPHGRPPRAG